MSTTKLNYVKEVFNNLKKESFLKKKNIATMNNIAKVSKTSRNNFYVQINKSSEWKSLVDEIKKFNNEFNEFTNFNNNIQKEKKKILESKKEVKLQMEQNLELLNIINDLYDEIKEKDSIIEHLEKRIYLQMQIKEDK